MDSVLFGAGLAALAAVGLAVQSLAVRVGTRTRSVSEVVAVVFAVNLLVLVPTAAVAAYPRYQVTVESLLAFAAAGVLGSLVARLAYFVGIARLGASRTEPLKALFPLVAVGMGVVVLGETVTAQLLGGVALVLGGGLAVVVEARDNPITANGRRLQRDLLFPLTAALLLGIDPIFTKVGLAEGTPPLVGVTIRIATAALGFILYTAWRRESDGLVPSVDVNRYLVVASLANTAYLLAYYAALSRAPVSVVTPVIGTSTVLVVAGAALFLQDDERVTGRLAVAALVVALGIALVLRA